MADIAIASLQDNQVILRIGETTLTISDAQVASVIRCEDGMPQRDAIYLSREERTVLGKLCGWVSAQATLAEDQRQALPDISDAGKELSDRLSRELAE